MHPSSRPFAFIAALALARREQRDLVLIDRSANGSLLMLVDAVNSDGPPSKATTA